MTLRQRQREMKQRMKKARCNRQLTIQQEHHARWLRSRGWTLKEIGKLYGMSDVGILYVIRRGDL